MAGIIKKPRLAILGEFDGTDFVGALYERNDNEISGVLNTNSEPHFDIIAFLNGYGSKSGQDLNSELAANKPSAYSTFTGGLDENGFFYLQADDDFQFGTFEDNRAKFGFTGDESTVLTNGNFRMTATNRWQRGVFEIERGGANNKIGLSLTDVTPSTSYSAQYYYNQSNSDTIRFSKADMTLGEFNALEVGYDITNEATSHTATYSSSLDHPSIEISSNYSSFRDEWSALFVGSTVLEDPSGNEYALKHKYFVNSKFYLAVERVGHTVTPSASTSFSWTHPDEQGGTVTKTVTSNNFFNTRQLVFPTSSLSQDDYNRLVLPTTATDSNGNDQYIMGKLQSGGQNRLFARPLGTFTPDATLSWSGGEFDFEIREKFSDTNNYYVTAYKNDHVFTPSNTETYKHTNSVPNTITGLQSSELINTSVLLANTSSITVTEYNALTVGQTMTDDNGFSWEFLHKYDDGSSGRFLVSKPDSSHNTATANFVSKGITKRFSTTDLPSAAYNSIVEGTTVFKDNYNYYRVELKNEVVVSSTTYRQLYLMRLGHDSSLSGNFTWQSGGTTYTASSSYSAYETIELELTNITSTQFNALNVSDYVDTTTGGDVLKYDASGRTGHGSSDVYSHTITMKYESGGSYRAITRYVSSLIPKFTGESPGPPFDFEVTWGLDDSGDNLYWSTSGGYTVQWDGIDTARRVQNLPTYLRVRGSVGDADDIYNGKCLEDWEHTAGNTSASLVLEEDGRVSINYPSNFSYDEVNTNSALGKSLLLRLGFDGTETETTTFGDNRQLRATNPAPCAMTSRGYVELRRETLGRDDFSIMADGSVISAGLAPIKGWSLLIRVTGPAHGYSVNRERHLREWWKHARRGLTIYPTFGDPDNNGDGGNDTRRHVNIETIYGTADRHTLFQTVEADESAHHYGKRVGGRLLVRRHPADAQERRESYSGEIDMHQDIRLRLLDDPTR